MRETTRRAAGTRETPRRAAGMRETTRRAAGTRETTRRAAGTRETTQQHHHSTQMGMNGPDDTAAVPGARHAASGQRGAARTCRATASTEQTNAPRRGPPTSQSHAQQQRSRTQWARTDPTTRPPSAALRAERAGREAPDVPAGPLRAASRRTRLPGATASRPSTQQHREQRAEGALKGNRPMVKATPSGCQSTASPGDRARWPIERQGGVVGTQELAHGGIEGHQATLQGDLAVATLLGRWKANPPPVHTKKARRRRD